MGPGGCTERICAGYVPTCSRRRTGRGPLLLPPGSLALPLPLGTLPLPPKTPLPGSRARSSRSPFWRGANRLLDHIDGTPDRIVTVPSLTAGGRSVDYQLAGGRDPVDESVAEALRILPGKTEIIERNVENDVSIHLVDVLAAGAAGTGERNRCNDAYPFLQLRSVHRIRCTTVEKGGKPAE